MKSSKFVILTLFTLLSFTGFAQQADSVSTKLLGKLFGTWQSKAVYNKGTVISRPGQTLKLKVDAKYIIKRGKAVLDSGTFNTNEVESTIYFQSATDKDKLQEWTVALTNGDAMTLTARKGSKSFGLKYEYVKLKDDL